MKKLVNMSKPRFDPNKPFTDVPSKPKFDPSKPFTSEPEEKESTLDSVLGQLDSYTTGPIRAGIGAVQEGMGGCGATSAPPHCRGPLGTNPC